MRAVIVGDGPDRARLEALADGQVMFMGRVSDDLLAQLYATCRAVYYAPFDEDYGMVPFEAFRSARPVVTTSDAGGPLEVVHDRRTGLVVEARPDAIAAALRDLFADEGLARSLGTAGQAATEGVNWDVAIGSLLG